MNELIKQLKDTFNYKIINKRHIKNTSVVFIKIHSFFYVVDSLPLTIGLQVRTMPTTLGIRISTMVIRTTTIRTTTTECALLEDFKQNEQNVRYI
jgi:hypothetical protein